jgi:hypothetical protein
LSLHRELSENQLEEHNVFYDRFSSLIHYQAKPENYEIDSKTGNCTTVSPGLGRVNINIVVDGVTLIFQAEISPASRSPDPAVHRCF